MVFVENNSKSWEKLSSQYYLGEIQDREIIVKMGSFEQEDNDVTCLRYFFPLCHGLHQMGIIPSDEHMRLRIDLSAIEENRIECIMRIKAFLSAVGRSDEYEIIINGSPISTNPKKWDGSNIFPLFEVSSGEDTQYINHYSLLQSRELPEKQFHTDAMEMLYHFRNALKTKVLSTDYYAGTQEYKITSGNKEELSYVLNNRLSEWLPQMSILAQIIWLYILRILIETKEIWNTDSKKTSSVDDNKIQKSRIDAVTYGEGMYQLIENACLHSDGRTAWFGFRVHSAGGQIAMSEFFSEANTRNRLHMKYKYCYTNISDSGKELNLGNSIFNKKERFFFEFYVLDDAHNQNGIVETHNNALIKPEYKKLWTRAEDNRKEQWIQSCEKDENYKKENPEFVEQIFDEHIVQRVDLWKEAENLLKMQGLLAEKIGQIINKKPFKGPLDNHAAFLRHLEDVTTHYGLRLLQHIVSINNGYIMCKTPQVQRDVLKYYNGNDTDGRADKNRYITEWHAIMPISYHWEANQEPQALIESGGAFGKIVRQKRSKLINIVAESLFNHTEFAPDRYRCTSVDDKRRYIYAIAKQLFTHLGSKDYATLSDAVIFIDMNLNHSWMLELLSKALYSTIAKIHYEQNDVVSLRIALSFRDIDLCNEFTRLFSMFYVDGTQEDMIDVQIAICSIDKDGLNQCNYILAGTDLNSAWESANISAHYGSKETLARLPILAYLTQPKKGIPQKNPDIIFHDDLQAHSIPRHDLQNLYINVPTS